MSSKCQLIGSWGMRWQLYLYIELPTFLYYSFVEVIALLRAFRSAVMYGPKAHVGRKHYPQKRRIKKGGGVGSNFLRNPKRLSRCAFLKAILGIYWQDGSVGKGERLDSWSLCPDRHWAQHRQKIIKRSRCWRDGSAVKSAITPLEDLGSDPTSLPSSHIWWLMAINNLSLGGSNIWALWATALACCIHAHTFLESKKVIFIYLWLQ